jgi:type IV secretion system protein VirD4
MSRKPRLIASAIALPLALVAGLALASAVVLLLLQQPLEQFRWHGFWGYWQQVDNPEWQPLAGRIKAAGAMGFGLPALAWLLLLFKSLQSPERALHGDAKFASKGDLAAKGLLKAHDQGVVVGQIGGQRIRLAGQQFVILAAPTRSGKGVGIVIPNLLDYRDSMVVLDIKQENFDLTSGWRKSIGHQVFLFNPFAEDRRTHRWNPLSYVSSDPSFRVSDLQSIAAMLYPDGDERNKFWTSQARNAFLALALYVFERHDGEVGDSVPAMKRRPPTLGRLYRLSSGDGQSELKAYLQALAKAEFLGDATRNAFATLLSQAPETFASIMGSFKEPLNAWINPVLDAATSADDFRLDDVRKKRMTIYVGIQPNKLAESRLIVNLFFSQLINVNTKTLPQNDPALKHQCLLLMDEFTAIGKVDIIATAVSYMAGYNLRLLPIIQSLAQLDAVYGREQARTLVTNHALQIVFTPREQQDAEDYSQMLGTTTEKRKTVTRGSSNTVGEAIERRALMLPQELKALPNDREIVFYEGIPNPVMAEKIRYYEDREYKARLLPKVEVRPLRI